jgi:hypothetical protein
MLKNKKGCKSNDCSLFCFNEIAKIFTFTPDSGEYLVSTWQVNKSTHQNYSNILIYIALAY